MKYFKPSEEMTQSVQQQHSSDSEGLGSEASVGVHDVAVLVISSSSDGCCGVAESGSCVVAGEVAVSIQPRQHSSG